MQSHGRRQDGSERQRSTLRSGFLEPADARSPQAPPATPRPGPAWTSKTGVSSTATVWTHQEAISTNLSTLNPHALKTERILLVKPGEGSLTKTGLGNCLNVFSADQTVNILDFVSHLPWSHSFLSFFIFIFLLVLFNDHF